MSNNGQLPDLLSRQQAAKYLGISETTLAIWQSTGRYSLPVVKVGRLAKYRRLDLEQFLRSRTMTKAQQPAKRKAKKTSAARDMAKESHWRSVITKQEQSGLSVRNFCQREKVRESQFHWWKRELRLRDRESQAAPKRQPCDAQINPFVPVQLVPDRQHAEESEAAPIEIFLPSGAKIVLKAGAPLSLVAQLLAEIERSKC